jgi:hypothetical protein
VNNELAPVQLGQGAHALAAEKLIDGREVPKRVTGGHWGNDIGLPAHYPFVR